MIESIIQQISSHFEKQVKPFLNAPATLQEVADAETKMEITFPDDLRALYLTHNGEMESGPGLFFGLPFLSLDDMLAEWEVWFKLTNDEELNEIDAYSVPNSHIKEQYINRYWIPISSDGGGNNLGIDFDPDIYGTRGQVINYGRDEEIKYVIANSITDLLTFILQTLINGPYSFNEEEESWSYGAIEEIHFFDTLKDMELPVLHPSNKQTTQRENWFAGLDKEWKDIIDSLVRVPKQFEKMKTLYLMNKNISDIAPLSICTDPREVVLSGNSISNLAPLKSLQTIKKLYLGGNPVIDISPLSPLTGLSYLNIKNTLVSNLNPLADLTKLKELDMGNVPAQDFKFLNSIKTLNNLSVSILNYEQLKAISNTTSLKKLHIYELYRVTAEDLVLLGNLKNLISLTFEHCIFNEFELRFLSRFKKLQYLTFNDCFIKDATPISELKTLTHLELSNTAVDSIEMISKSISLQSFAGSFNQFCILKNLMGEHVDFSKIIGGMSDEEQTIWHNSFRN